MNCAIDNGMCRLYDGSREVELKIIFDTANPCHSERAYCGVDTSLKEIYVLNAGALQDHELENLIRTTASFYKAESFDNIPVSRTVESVQPILRISRAA